MMTSVLDFFEKTAYLYPDKIAFSDPISDISYKDLRRTAQIFGEGFIDGSMWKAQPKVKCEDSVAFFMEKNVKCLGVMFGAVYAGAFYSFIDVRQTADRTLAIVDCLKPAAIVTDDENQETVRRILDGTAYLQLIVNISDLYKYATQQESTLKQDCLLEEARKHFTDTMPLYVNFTSGSTGIPKGVAVSHRSVIDFISCFTQTFGISSDDVIANQAPFDFDVSVKDIYSGIFTGAQVRLIPREYFTNPTALMDYLCDGKVTTLIWAVSAMCFVSIMNGLEYKVPETVNKIMFSGELMPVKQLNKWVKFLPNATYVNLYGPTEITCNCTYHIIDRQYEKGEVIPIGVPFDNEKVFLLDENDKLITQPGVEGEICVCGTCLAIGYYKDKEKTEASFVQNPLNDRYYERMYRTGDLGRLDEEGRLVYTSRKDFQIKHMGQRIELGDIENSAMTIDGVARACCLYDEKKKKILLYYVGECDKEKVSEKLHDKLPAFMIPGKTTKIDEFPLNKNGKIDRNRLVEIDD